MATIMTADEHHITNLPTGRGRRLYYYQGNFYHPLDLIGPEPGLIKRGIRDFMKQNAAMVAADRADQAYKTLMQLAEDTP